MDQVGLAGKVQLTGMDLGGKLPGLIDGGKVHIMEIVGRKYLYVMRRKC